MFYDCLKWDETKQVCALEIGDEPSMTREAGRTAWNVMVIRRRLGWLTSSGSFQEIFVALPPVVVVGTVCADAFEDAIFEQPLARHVEGLIRKFRELAHTSFAIRECDGDKKNVRMLAWERPHHVSRGTFHTYLTCGLHENGHLVSFSVQLVGRHLYDGMFAWSKLVRIGNFWARTCLCIRHVVASEWQIIFEEPPARTKEARDLVTDLFFLKPLTKNGVPPSAKSLQQHESLVKEFRTMLNGSPFGSTLVHYCGDWCGCADRSATIERITRLLVRTVFRRRPAIPQLSEWFTVQASMAFLAFACGTQSLHRKVFEKSVSAFESDPAKPDGSGLSLVPAACLTERVGAPQASERFSENLDLRELNSKRVGYGGRHLMQPDEDRVAGNWGGA